MKRWKIAITLLVLLGLIGSCLFAIRVKSSTSSQVGMAKMVDGKQQLNHSKDPTTKVKATPGTASVEISDTKAITNHETVRDGTTTPPEKNSTTTDSQGAKPTSVTNRSWFMIPGEVKWNNVRYVLNLKKRITVIGKEIGVGQDSLPSDYPIFEIPGIDPAQEVAVDVHQRYFEAFPQK